MYTYSLRASFSVDWAQGAIPALLPYFISSCNLNYQDAATLIFANMLLSSVSQPIFGYYSDKVSKPWFAPLGPILCGLCLTMLAFTQNYWLIFLCSMFSGFGSSIYHPEAARMVNNIAGDRKGQAMGTFCRRRLMPASPSAPMVAGACAYAFDIHGLARLRHRQRPHRLRPLPSDAAHLISGQQSGDGRKKPSRGSPDQRLERLRPPVRRHLRPFHRLYGLQYLHSPLLDPRPPCLAGSRQPGPVHSLFHVVTAKRTVGIPAVTSKCENSSNFTGIRGLKILWELFSDLDFHKSTSRRNHFCFKPGFSCSS